MWVLRAFQMASWPGALFAVNWYMLINRIDSPDSRVAFRARTRPANGGGCADLPRRTLLGGGSQPSRSPTAEEKVPRWRAVKTQNW